jgi:hypothetical protein
MQLWPAGHTTPHAPQWPSVDCRSTQTLAEPVPQTLRGASQDALQVPPLQSWPAGHTTPHAPQWAASALVSTQRPPQSDWPVGHTHAPATQVWEAAQALPQVPQCATVLRGSTQVSPQRVCSGGQVGGTSGAAGTSMPASVASRTVATSAASMPAATSFGLASRLPFGTSGLVHPPATSATKRSDDQKRGISMEAGLSCNEAHRTMPMRRAGTLGETRHHAPPRGRLRAPPRSRTGCWCRSPRASP